MSSILRDPVSFAVAANAHQNAVERGIAAGSWASQVGIRCITRRFHQPSLNPISVGRPPVRKLIAFDDDTFDKLKQLARDRMATIQELADEAFADLLKKHGIPLDLKDALRKSAALKQEPARQDARKNSPRKSR
jgi:hypothetical protein